MYYSNKINQSDSSKYVFPLTKQPLVLIQVRHEEAAARHPLNYLLYL